MILLRIALCALLAPCPPRFARLLSPKLGEVIGGFKVRRWVVRLNDKGMGLSMNDLRAKGKLGAVASPWAG